VKASVPTSCEGNVIALSYLATDPQVRCLNGSGHCIAMSYKNSTTGSLPYNHHIEESLQIAERFFPSTGSWIDGAVGEWPWSNSIQGPPGFDQSYHPCAYTPRSFCWSQHGADPNGLCRTCGIGVSRGPYIGPGGVNGNSDGGGTATSMNRYPCNSVTAAMCSQDWVSTICPTQCGSPQPDCLNYYNGNEIPNDYSEVYCGNLEAFAGCPDECPGSFCNYCSCVWDSASSAMCMRFCDKCNIYPEITTPLVDGLDCESCNCNNPECKYLCDHCNPGICSFADCQDDILAQGCPKCIQHCDVCAKSGTFFPACLTEQCSQCPHCSIDCSLLTNESPECLTLPSAWCPECSFTNSSGPVDPNPGPGPGPLGGPCNSLTETTQCGFCSCENTQCVTSCGSCCREKVASGQDLCLTPPYGLSVSPNNCEFFGNVSTLVTVELQTGQTACFKGETRAKSTHGHLIIEEMPELKVSILSSYITYTLLDGYYSSISPHLTMSCYCHCIGSPAGDCDASSNKCHGKKHCYNLYVGDSGGKGCLGNSNTCCTLRIDANQFGVLYKMGGPQDIISQVEVSFGNFTTTAWVSLFGSQIITTPDKLIEIRAAGYLQSLPFQGNLQILEYQGELYDGSDFNGHNDYDADKPGWLKINADAKGNMVSDDYIFAEEDLKSHIYVTTKNCAEDKYEEKMDISKSDLGRRATLQELVKQGSVAFTSGQLRGVVQLKFESGNPLIITINATQYQLQYIERTIHVKKFSCSGVGDVETGVILNCVAEVDAVGGTVYFWQVDKQGRIVLTETVFAGSQIFNFSLTPDLEPSSNQSNICTNGKERDLCATFTFKVDADPLVDPNWSIPVTPIPGGRLNIDDEFGGDNGNWKWWNPFSWFDEGELVKSILGVMGYTVVGVAIILCCLCCCVILIYLGPEIASFVIYLAGLVAQLWKCVCLPFTVLKKIKGSMSKFRGDEREVGKEPQEDIEPQRESLDKVDIMQEGEKRNSWKFWKRGRPVYLNNQSVEMEPISPPAEDAVRRGNVRGNAVF